MLIAKLACLYEGVTEATASVARGGIKPKASYGPKAAHNALPDVRAVEIFAAGSSLTPETLGVCTGVGGSRGSRIR